MQTQITEVPSRAIAMTTAEIAGEIAELAQELAEPVPTVRLVVDGSGWRYVVVEPVQC